ncbi:MAG TPA: YggS family pyridoxal phosphate-dependent enzyme [Verrucomicrobiae bacterium]|jgi:pyridoxal phosphate enzyme (YggS family)|nr:YggS family pyridoxal phosphate-dependent enzyme [Verrucomicrobiae bacterium]
MPPTIRENILRIQDRIAKAQQKSPHPAEVTLIAVSKTHSPESISEAYEAGLRHFGENRVQEWEGKRPQLEDLPATWHLIGHLQSNKSARAAKAFHSIDSVDDFALAQRLDHARSELNLKDKLRVLIEVRVENEATKTGAELHTVPQLLQKITQLKNLQVAGLMCIPPFLEAPEKVRPYFQRLRNLRDNLAATSGLRLPVLSMGMSHDFEVAIQEGATEVRIGTAIFGTRPNP